MRHGTLTAFSLIAVASALGQGTSPTPAEQFTRLAAEYDAIDEKFMKELRADRTREAVQAANDRNREAMNDWWKRALELIRQHPAEPAAIPVIEKYLSRNVVGNVELVGVLRKYHMRCRRSSRWHGSTWRAWGRGFLPGLGTVDEVASFAADGLQHSDHLAKVAT